MGEVRSAKTLKDLTFPRRSRAGETRATRKAGRGRSIVLDKAASGLCPLASP